MGDAIDFPVSKRGTERPEIRLVESKRKRFCIHHFEVHEADREVRCVRCEARIDPFEAMVFISEMFERYRLSIACLKQEIA